MLDRYTLKPMKELWGSEEVKFGYWLQVELDVLRARCMLVELSAPALKAIVLHAKFDVVRIKKLEAIYDHDMIAFIACVQEYLERAGAGQYKEEFHKRLTSYDVEDPAMILMLREAVNLILHELERLHDTLQKRANEHKWTLMIARTHGQYAEPTTFGHLLLVYAEAVARSIRRLYSAYNEDLAEIKLSGAVGSYGGLDPRIEMLAFRDLGLRAAHAETQILQRDRHAALLSALAIAAGTIEQMCRTFWEMMRSDVDELEEPRKATQRGSSAMAHKKNPILVERLMGMARLMRGYAHAAQENIATPEGRDISQSSVERNILPDATALLHYMASRAAFLVDGLVVHTDVMLDTLENRTFGVWATQPVRMALMEAGVPYDTAYEYLQRCAFEAIKRKFNLKWALSISAMPLSEQDPRTALDILGERKLYECFDARRYIECGIEHMFAHNHNEERK